MRALGGFVTMIGVSHSKKLVLGWSSVSWTSLFALMTLSAYHPTVRGECPRDFLTLEHSDPGAARCRSTA